MIESQRLRLAVAAPTPGSAAGRSARINWVFDSASTDCVESLRSKSGGRLPKLHFYGLGRLVTGPLSIFRFFGARRQGPEPTRRPRVVLIGPTLRGVGGISTHMNQLLGSSLSERVELLHFQVGSDGLPESRAHMLVRLATSPASFVRVLIARRPSIVHLNSPMVPKAFWRDVVYFFVARLLGIKVIYQVHGGTLPHQFLRRSHFLNRQLGRIFRACEAVVLLARVEMDAYRKFVPGARLELIANAIDAGALACGAIADKPKGILHLVYMGRLIEEKGIFDAVEALAILVREKRSVMLSIAGSGPQERELRTRVADRGLQHLVHFVGRLFDSRKEALWLSAHIFVFPTFFLEGLPYALLEAMAAGAVPITTRIGAIPDVVEDGVHGVLVPAHEPVALAAAVARLDDDRGTLAGMAEAGRQRVVERYTTVRLADDFGKLYSSVMQA